MSTNFQLDDDGALDRATAALRDVPIPSGPSRQLQSATVAALSRGASLRPARGYWRLTRARWLARAAVLACLAAGAAAAYFAVLRHHDGYAREPAPPLLPPRTIDNPNSAVVPAGGSMVTGEIRFEGDAPPPRLIDFGAARGGGERGNQPVYDDSLLVNLDDTLQNVVVSVVAGLPRGRKYPAPGTPVYLDELACSFQPHVLAMQTGQPIVLRDSDPVPHNAHSLSVRNKSFNIIEPAGDAGLRLPSPAEPEVFQVRCDIQPWMKCWFCAFSHPYFDVSLTNGTFTLRRLPPGHYRLRAWQERLGTLERDIIVKSGRDETVNFVYRMPPMPKPPQAAGPRSPPITAALDAT